MDTYRQLKIMMFSLIGKNRDVLNGIEDKYNVTIIPHYNKFEICGDRNNVIKAHESISRAYQRRKSWVLSR